MNGNEHGGGAKGRTGCYCDLCVTARREYTHLYETTRRKPRSESLPREQTRVPHGGGVRGRKNCKCEPCKIRNRQYENERRRRVGRSDRKKRA